MWNKTALSERLQIRLPIIQAPMGGGPGTPQLVAAVSEAGGLGSLAGGYLTPAQIRAAIRDVRARTRKPFALNLFVDERPRPDAAAVARAQAALRPFREEAGLPPEAPVPEKVSESFDEQFAVLLEEVVPVFSFTFGIPAPAALAECRARGIVSIGTATHVEEGRALEAAGVDAICAQGAEAGAHRGTFIGEAEEALIGNFALLPRLLRAVRRPLVAAGGIMDGGGIVAALALGAQAAQLGTAFLRTPESGASAAYQAALTEARSSEITRAFSGRAARGLSNRLLRALAQTAVPAYPIQNALTRDLRAAAAKLGNAELLSLWAGQAAELVRDLPAAELMAALEAEAQAAVERLAK